MRFKDENSKFSGSIGYFFQDYVSDYLQAARDYDLSSTQKLQLMHNIFTGDAKLYYYDRLECYASGFNQAVDMIKDEYNSPVRQDRCKNSLSAMRVARFVKDRVEVSEALGKVYKAITNLRPQVPQSHRGEAHRVEFLRTAIIAYDWAFEPLSRIATHRLIFQQLHGELQSALHLSKESESARLRDQVARSATLEDEVSGIMYQSQGRYLNRRNGLSTRNWNSNQRQDARTRGSADQLKLMDCFNCEDRNHVLYDCKKPLNLAWATKTGLNTIPRSSRCKMPHIKSCMSFAVNSSQTKNATVLRRSCQPRKNDDRTEEYEIKFAQSIFGVAPDVDEPTEEPVRSPYDKLIHKGICAFSSQELINFAKQRSVEFSGDCMDYGAQVSVVGEPQAKAFCQDMSIGYVLDVSGHPRQFKFGDYAQNSNGTLEFRVTVGQNYFVSIIANVVEIDVPLILGLDILESYKLVIDVAG